MFHELGHIGHLYGISDDDEKCADKWSRNTLIPREDFRIFKEGRDYTENSVIEFAHGQKIAPGLTVYSLLSVFLFGLFFSLMVMYMDSLWCAMACHTGWNFTQSILLGLPNSGYVVPYSIFRLDAASARDSFAYSTSFGIEGSLLMVIVLTVFIAVTVWYFEAKKKKEA